MSLFGTDGIRDLAGAGRLAPSTVRRVGRALARHAAARTPGRVPRVVLGRDPRPSGPLLVEQLCDGLTREGARVVDLGVLPTPAVAWAAAAWDYDLGIMVSASHNPEADNGIKPFALGGRKLTTSEERDVELEVERLGESVPTQRRAPEVVSGAERYAAETLDLLRGGPSLAGLRLTVDLAAGATSATAPPVLAGLGVTAEFLHPAGSRPINLACGSEHPEAWLARLRATGADGGLAFDGDGDRVLVADAAGEVLDGDDLLALLAEDMLATGALAGRTLVATVMSNLGLDERLAALGARAERVAVGDRNVAERMRALGAPLGGEASGHIVLARARPGEPAALLGDGLVAGVRALQAARRLGKSLTVLRAQRRRYPQALENLRVAQRRDVSSLPRLAAAVRALEKEFGTRGRVLVRPSGTEPLLRIMVEHVDAETMSRSLAHLVEIARAELA